MPNSGPFLSSPRQFERSTVNGAPPNRVLGVAHEFWHALQPQRHRPIRTPARIPAGLGFWLPPRQNPLALHAFQHTPPIRRRYQNQRTQGGPRTVGHSFHRGQIGHRRCAVLPTRPGGFPLRPALRHHDRQGPRPHRKAHAPNHLESDAQRLVERTAAGRGNHPRERSAGKNRSRWRTESRACRRSGTAPQVLAVLRNAIVHLLAAVDAQSLPEAIEQLQIHPARAQELIGISQSV